MKYIFFILFYIFINKTYSREIIISNNEIEINDGEVTIKESCSCKEQTPPIPPVIEKEQPKEIIPVISKDTTTNFIERKVINYRDKYSSMEITFHIIISFISLVVLCYFINNIFYPEFTYDKTSTGVIFYKNGFLLDIKYNIE